MIQLYAFVLSAFMVFMPAQIYSMDRDWISPVTGKPLETVMARAQETMSERFQDIAHMRLTLFKEFPYLYEGDEEGEREYLESYFNADTACLILLYDQGEIVGFSSGVGLHEEMPDIQKPFARHGLNTQDYYYVGEVMLKAPYQKKGLTKIFQEHHNWHIQNLKARGEGNFSKLTLMTVVRPDDHPLYPEGYEPIDGILNHFGFQKSDTLFVHLPWSQVDQEEVVDHTLNIWIKEGSTL